MDLNRKNCDSSLTPDSVVSLNVGEISERVTKAFQKLSMKESQLYIRNVIFFNFIKGFNSLDDRIDISIQKISEIIGSVMDEHNIDDETKSIIGSVLFFQLLAKN